MPVTRIGYQAPADYGTAVKPVYFAQGGVMVDVTESAEGVEVFEVCGEVVGGARMTARIRFALAYVALQAACAVIGLTGGFFAVVIIGGLFHG